MLPLNLFPAASLPEAQSAPRKSLALPAAGHPPTFNQVVQIVLAGIADRLAVGVLCLTEESLAIK